MSDPIDSLITGEHDRQERAYLKWLAAQGMETAKPPRHEVGSARKGDSPVTK